MCKALLKTIAFFSCSLVWAAEKGNTLATHLIRKEVLPVQSEFTIDLSALDSIAPHKRKRSVPRIITQCLQGADRCSYSAGYTTCTIYTQDPEGLLTRLLDAAYKQGVIDVKKEEEGGQKEVQAEQGPTLPNRWTKFAPLLLPAGYFGLGFFSRILLERYVWGQQG